MAYDPYESRRGWREPRSRPREDRSQRGYSDSDERGFFERAGDEISSWFGDEEAERRRMRDDPDRDRRGAFGGGQSSNYRRDTDRDYGSRQRFSGESGGFGGGANRYGRADHDRDYRPLTGDYGRSEDERGRPTGREAFGDRYGYGSAHQGDTFDRGTSQRLAGRGGFDPQYGEWRQRQIDSLDRDYDEFRRENQSRFDSEFANWRDRRQTKRQLLGQIREHMEVLGNDNEHVGTVDRIAGDRIILTKSDEDAGGVHHSLMCTAIDRVEGDKVILDTSAEQAKAVWRDENRDRALFEREDQGEAGPHILDRSFSGTYR